MSVISDLSVIVQCFNLIKTVIITLLSDKLCGVGIRFHASVPNGISFIFFLDLSVALLFLGCNSFKPRMKSVNLYGIPLFAGNGKLHEGKTSLFIEPVGFVKQSFKNRYVIFGHTVGIILKRRAFAAQKHLCFFHRVFANLLLQRVVFRFGKRLCGSKHTVVDGKHARKTRGINLFRPFELCLHGFVGEFIQLAEHYFRNLYLLIERPAAAVFFSCRFYRRFIARFFCIPDNIL